VIGSNTTAQHPLIGTRIVNAVDRGARFLLFDPRETPFAPLATIHLRHNLGTEVALVNGVMNIIIQEDLHDRVYIESRTEGFDGLKAVLGRYTPRWWNRSRASGPPTLTALRSCMPRRTRP
jgi:anaerobic selenocysteine-containing dehydrogenase